MGLHHSIFTDTDLEKRTCGDYLLKPDPNPHPLQMGGYVYPIKKYIEISILHFNNSFYISLQDLSFLYSLFFWVRVEH